MNRNSANQHTIDSVYNLNTALSDKASLSSNNVFAGNVDVENEFISSCDSTDTLKNYKMTNLNANGCSLVSIVKSTQQVVKLVVNETGAKVNDSKILTEDSEIVQDVVDLGNLSNLTANTLGVKSQLPDPTKTVIENINLLPLKHVLTKVLSDTPNTASFSFSLDQDSSYKVLLQVVLNQAGGNLSVTYSTDGTTYDATNSYSWRRYLVSTSNITTVATNAVLTNEIRLNANPVILGTNALEVDFFNCNSVFTPILQCEAKNSSAGVINFSRTIGGFSKVGVKKIKFTLTGSTFGSTGTIKSVVKIYKY